MMKVKEVQRRYFLIIIENTKLILERDLGDCLWMKCDRSPGNGVTDIQMKFGNLSPKLEIGLSEGRVVIPTAGHVNQDIAVGLTVSREVLAAEQPGMLAGDPWTVNRLVWDMGANMTGILLHKETILRRGGGVTRVIDIGKMQFSSLAEHVQELVPIGIRDDLGKRI